jgi:hypothetical protein
VTEAFTAENALEVALVRATRDPAARPAFYRALLEAQLYFIIPAPPPAEERSTLAAGSQLALMSWTGPRGDFTPCFTSRGRLEDAAREVGGELGFVAIAGQAAFGLLAQVPMAAVLNPGSQYGKELSRDEIKRLADGTILASTPRVVARDTQVLLGQPATSPTALIAALGRLFTRHPTVEAAYLAQIHDPSSGDPPHPIVGILASDHEAVLGEASLVAAAVMDTPVDFVVVAAHDSDGVSGYLRGSTTPFYERDPALAPTRS